MPPRPRDASAGLFHVYTHSVWAAPGLYRDDVDRLEFPRHLARVTRSIGWKCRLSCCVALEQLRRDRGRDGTRLLCGSNRAHPRVRRPGDRPASRTAHFRGGGVTVPYRYLLPVCRLGGGYLL